MYTKHVVVIGTSAGGIETLRGLVGSLPADFPAAVAIVMHTAPDAPGLLHQILGRSGALPVVDPRNGERLQPGRIYVAPPDRHLLLEPGRICLTRGPRENGFRPAIDPLFRSAAQVYGPGAAGVILTGNLDDGTAGLWAIKQLGGAAIVQDPADALFPSMPQNAVDHVSVDHVVPLAELAPLLVRLTARRQEPEEDMHMEVPEHVEIEVKVAKEEHPLAAGVERLGGVSAFSCPECHGVLRELKENGRARFRCHTGHAYSMDSLLAEIDSSVEVAVWNALRALQEGQMLLGQVLDRIEPEHAENHAHELRERARELERQAALLRQAVMSVESLARPRGSDSGGT